MRKFQSLPILAFLISSVGAAAQTAEIKLPLPHAASITAMCASADGKYLLTGSEDSSLKLWELESGREIRTFSGHTGAISAIALSPDGRLAASSSNEDSYRIWDLRSGATIQVCPIAEKPGYRYTVLSLAIRQEENAFAYASLASPIDRKLKTLWEIVVRDIASGKVLRRFDTEPIGMMCRLTDDGETALLSLGLGVPNALQFLDLKSGVATKKAGLPGKTGLSVSIDRSKNKALMGDYSGGVTLWDLAAGKKTWSSLSAAGEKGMITASALSPDGRYGYAVLGDVARLWDFSSGKEITPPAFAKADTKPSQAVFGRDGKTLYTAARDFGIRSWNLDSLGEARALERFASSVNALVVLGDGRRALAAGDDATVKLWDLSAQKVLRSYAGHAGRILALRLTPDGLSFVTASEDKTLKLWDLASGEALRTFSGHLGAVTSAAIAPDGRTLVSVSMDKTIRIWDLSSGLARRTIAESSKGLTAVAISPDGRFVLSGSLDLDKNVKLWDLEKGKLLRSFESDGFENHYYGMNFDSGVDSLAFAPDGKSFATGDMLTMRTWDIATGKELRNFGEVTYYRVRGLSIKGEPKNMKDARRVAALCYSADGRSLYCNAANGDIQEWEASSGLLLRSFKGRTGALKSFALGPDGSFAASGWSDGTIRLWDMKAGSLRTNLASSPDGRDYLAWTAEGYFDGTAKAMRDSLIVVKGLSVYPIDSFFERFHRPDIVGAFMNGTDTTALAKEDLRSGFAAPPLVSLLIGTKSGTFAEPEPAGIELRGLAVVAASKASDWLLQDGAITVRVVAKDGGGGVDELRLSVNGKAVSLESKGPSPAAAPKGGEDYSRDFSVSLTEGANAIRAVAFSRDRTESLPVEARVTFAPARSVKPRLFILAAAANQYRNAKYALNYALADAQSFSKALLPKAQRLFESVKLVELYDERLSRESLLAALDAIKREAAPEDAFIFFYAGHGVALPSGRSSEFYFVLPQVTGMQDPDKLAAAGLSGAELRAFMGGIKANKQMLLVDACNSGAFAQGFAVRGAAEDNALAQLSRSTGSVIIASTTDQQFAAEVGQLGHGAFSFALIDALNGGAVLSDGRITAGSVRLYIEDALPAIMKKYRGAEQFPTTFLFGQDFPIGLR